MSEIEKRDPNRRCSAPDCPTVLSIYNSDHLCFAHADMATRRRFERRTNGDRVLSLPSVDPTVLAFDIRGPISPVDHGMSTVIGPIVEPVGRA